MPDVLVVNLTRFGDLLQSQPLIHDLHDSGFSVGLVCLENFLPALPLLQHVEAAWPLPGSKLLGCLDADWKSAAALLLEFAQGIRREARPHHVLNLTATLPARLLTRLLAADGASILGFGLDAEGFGFHENVWFSFLSGAVRQRLHTPFNLVDMFRMAAVHLTPPEISSRPGRNGLQQPGPAAQTHAMALLAGAGTDARPEAQGLVALQLGASEERRQWPVAHFASLGDRLWQTAGLLPLLLGSRGERPLAAGYAAAARGPFIDAVGQTDIPQLAALLGQCRLLITNDTGTMHLAAGLGVPSLAFFLATAQPWDTGPYLPGCCCLEPAMPCHPCPYSRPCAHNQACRSRIAPEPVAELVLGWLRQGDWRAGLGPRLAASARVWQTGGDARGFAVVKPLSDHAHEERSLWLGQQRVFWRQILDEMCGSQSAGDTWAAGAPCTPALRQRVGPVLEQAGRLLELLAEQGRLVGRSTQAGQLFLRNCDRLQALLEGCPELAALGFFWCELRQERGGRMEELLSLISLMARHLHLWAAVLADGKLSD